MVVGGDGVVQLSALPEGPLPHAAREEPLSPRRVALAGQPAQPRSDEPRVGVDVTPGAAGGVHHRSLPRGIPGAGAAGDQGQVGERVRGEAGGGGGVVEGEGGGVGAAGGEGEQQRVDAGAVPAQR
eukprot:scaffold14628_cov118-Isochrysis_galbana.AAC.1